MAEQYSEINLSYNWLVLDSIKKMRDAQARKDQEQFVILFDFCLRLLIPYIAIELKEQIDTDRRTLLMETTRIKRDEKNYETAKKKILDLRVDFADAHLGYVMGALSTVGIVQVRDDGIINFNKIDIETTQNIIRQSGMGLAKAVERGMGNVESK